MDEPKHIYKILLFWILTFAPVELGQFPIDEKSAV